MYRYGSAAVVVSPGTFPVELEYSAPASALMQGQIGAPGTTRTTGVVFTTVVICLLFLVLIPVVANLILR